MRTMYDAIGGKARNIPGDAQLVAGYIDGAYAWTQAEWGLFPSSVKATITVFGSIADVADVEHGDMSATDAPLWAARMRDMGRVPSVYCSLSVQPAVRAAFAARGMPEPLWWLAHWDGVAAVPAGAVAMQYTDNSQIGSPYDTSAVLDYWPGVDGPALGGLNDMALIITGPAGQPAVLLANGAAVGLDSTADEQALNRGGVPTVALDTQAYSACIAAAPSTVLASILAELKAAGGAGSGGIGPIPFTLTLTGEATPASPAAPGAP